MPSFDPSTVIATSTSFPCRPGPSQLRCDRSSTDMFEPPASLNEPMSVEYGYFRLLDPMCFIGFALVFVVGTTFSLLEPIGRKAGQLSQRFGACPAAGTKLKPVHRHLHEACPVLYIDRWIDLTFRLAFAEPGNNTSS